jgi:hypothetical protein
MKRLIKKLLGIKELSQCALHNVMHCSCDYGVIVCPGCDGASTSNKGYVCAGCKGKGVRTCGKCGGLNNA